VSKQYKIVIFSAIKHACVMNDIILNWSKMKKFIRTENNHNSINGKDRGYTHQEIQTILEHSDLRTRAAFLLLSSCGCRVGALPTMKLGDLEKVDDLYIVTVYSGDKEEYIGFTTPETTTAIDEYLRYRSRRGEIINEDSYLFVRKFSQQTEIKGKPFTGKSLNVILHNCIDNTGLRKINHDNPTKRNQTVASY
jgi:integrase